MTFRVFLGKRRNRGIVSHSRKLGNGMALRFLGKVRVTLEFVGNKGLTGAGVERRVVGNWLERLGLRGSNLKVTSGPW